LPKDVDDISSEKLDWLTEQVVAGELASQGPVIVWCRWRRERERLAEMLASKGHPYTEVYGGQTVMRRDKAIRDFQCGGDLPRCLLAQPHAGGFGLNLTAAHVAVYLSNDYSWATRVQSEDRCHRVGQTNCVTYVDVLAISPSGGKTVDHAILAALKEKADIAQWTCAKWRNVLDD